MSPIYTVLKNKEVIYMGAKEGCFQLLLHCWVAATNPFNSLQVSAVSQCQGIKHRDAK